LKPELGAVGSFVVEEAAAPQHFERRAARRMTQRKVTPGLGGLAARGFDQLNEGQIGLGAYSASANNIGPHSNKYRRSFKPIAYTRPCGDVIKLE
jgi:hypothetical protein